jgi:tRNA (guanine-N7-)-methyltransferase
MGGVVEPDFAAEARRRYAAAPRLPEEATIDVRTLLPGSFSRLEIEVGPGRGGFLLGRLTRERDLGLLGFEIKRKWAVIVNERLLRHGLAERGRVFAEDVRLALPRLTPDGSLAALFFHFPDPWWKRRHTKRLVVGTDVLDHVARLLRPGGELFIQTDVEERAELYETQIGGHAAFVPRGDSDAGPRMAENPYDARSHRERRALEDDIPIYRLRFVRKGGAP